MKQQVGIGVIVAAIVIVLALVGMFGWRTIKSGGQTEKVPIDINKIKEDFQKNGMGGH